MNANLIIELMIFRVENIYNYTSINLLLQDNLLVYKMNS